MLATLRRVLAWGAAVATAAAAWAALVAAGTLYGWWKTPLAPRGRADVFVAAVRERAEARAHGIVALRVVEGGRAHDHFVSTGVPVDASTLFPVASLSKWVSAWGVMKLHEDGRLELDRPVARYLTRWSLPQSAFDNDSVTVRRLLSHTAGLTDGLGYNGFQADQELQSLEASLTQAADRDEDAEGRTRVGREPGTWRYSGGGYTLLQLVVEEVAGEPFAQYMRRAILDPLGMHRSTFVVAPTTPVVPLFDVQGRVLPPRRYTALAAAALHASIDDLGRFVAAHVPGATGEPVGRGVLRPDSVALMRTPAAFRYGAAIWGLGPILYVPNGRGDFVIGHDGRNAPALNAAARLDPATGDAIIVLASGAPLLATSIAGEWTFWKTGALDVLAVTQAVPRALRVVAAGWFVLLAGALWCLRRGRGRPRPASDLRG